MEKLDDDGAVLEAACPVCDQLRWEGPDAAHYEVVPARGGGWHHWAAALDRLLTRLRHGPTMVVIVDRPGTNHRYVQLMIGHGRVIVEASSNDYLLDDSRLTADHEELLDLLGWEWPPAGADEPEAEPANWTLPVDRADSPDLVEILLATIVGVFGFDEHAPVQVRTFMVDSPCRDCFPTPIP